MLLVLYSQASLTSTKISQLTWPMKCNSSSMHDCAIMWESERFVWPPNSWMILTSSSASVSHNLWSVCLVWRVNCPFSLHRLKIYSLRISKWMIFFQFSVLTKASFQLGVILHACLQPSKQIQRLWNECFQSLSRLSKKHKKNLSVIMFMELSWGGTTTGAEYFFLMCNSITLCW